MVRKDLQNAHLPFSSPVRIFGWDDLEEPRVGEDDGIIDSVALLRNPIAKMGTSRPSFSIWDIVFVLCSVRNDASTSVFNPLYPFYTRLETDVFALFFFPSSRWTIWGACVDLYSRPPPASCRSCTRKVSATRWGSWRERPGWADGLPEPRRIG